MKRSKTFLGIATTLLSLVGVFASRYNQVGRRLWYVTAASNICRTVQKNCDNAGTHICYYVFTVTAGGATTQYTAAVFATGGLNNQQTFYAPGATNCISTVHYSISGF